MDPWLCSILQLIFFLNIFLFHFGFPREEWVASFHLSPLITSLPSRDTTKPDYSISYMPTVEKWVT